MGRGRSGFRLLMLGLSLTLWLNALGLLLCTFFWWGTASVDLAKNLTNGNSLFFIGKELGDGTRLGGVDGNVNL